MKFSIITPCYNSEKFIEKTINSVINQVGDFEIEYILVDGSSEDTTLDIIKKYQSIYKDINTSSKIEIKYISEKDTGMYDAINKGFSMSSGDIMAWINSDDYYKENAFRVIDSVFKKYPDIDWLKGYTIFVNENDSIINTGQCIVYNRNWIKKGIYGRNAPFIHQDSVFWKRSLWDKSNHLDSNLKVAGDYKLWLEFSKQSRLWSINTPISTFRKREGQLSSNMQRYRMEQNTISKETGPINKIVKIFFWVYNILPKKIANIFAFLYPLICPPEQRKYIEIEKNNILIKTANRFYIK